MIVYVHQLTTFVSVWLYLICPTLELTMMQCRTCTVSRIVTTFPALTCLELQHLESLSLAKTLVSSSGLLHLHGVWFWDNMTSNLSKNCRCSGALICQIVLEFGTRCCIPRSWMTATGCSISICLQTASPSGASATTVSGVLIVRRHSHFEVSVTCQIEPVQNLGHCRSNQHVARYKLVNASSHSFDMQQQLSRCVWTI